MNPLKLKKLLDHRCWFEKMFNSAKERIATAREYADKGDYEMACKFAEEAFEIADGVEKKASAILK